MISFPILPPPQGAFAALDLGKSASWERRLVVAFCRAIGRRRVCQTPVAKRRRHVIALAALGRFVASHSSAICAPPRDLTATR